MGERARHAIVMRASILFDDMLHRLLRAIRLLGAKDLRTYP